VGHKANVQPVSIPFSIEWEEGIDFGLVRLVRSGVDTNASAWPLLAYFWEVLFPAITCLLLGSVIPSNSMQAGSTRDLVLHYGKGRT
jgi:hypothetical protein